MMAEGRKKVSPSRPMPRMTPGRGLRALNVRSLTPRQQLYHLPFRCSALLNSLSKLATASALLSSVCTRVPNHVHVSQLDMSLKRGATAGIGMVRRVASSHGSNSRRSANPSSRAGANWQLSVGRHASQLSIFVIANVHHIAETQCLTDNGQDD
jgi:hypothetical protein